MADPFDPTPDPDRHVGHYSFYLPARSIDLWLPSLRELLAQHGLHVVTDAERQVLAHIRKVDKSMEFVGELRVLLDAAKAMER